MHETGQLCLEPERYDLGKCGWPFCDCYETEPDVVPITLPEHGEVLVEVGGASDPEPMRSPDDQARTTLVISVDSDGTTHTQRVCKGTWEQTKQDLTCALNMLREEIASSAACPAKPHPQTSILSRKNELTQAIDMALHQIEEIASQAHAHIHELAARVSDNAEIRASVASAPVRAADGVVKLLRAASNWLKQPKGTDYKNAVNSYGRTPFEAADLIEQQAATIAALRAEIAELRAVTEEKVDAAIIAWNNAEGIGNAHYGTLSQHNGAHRIRMRAALAAARKVGT